MKRNLRLVLALLLALALCFALVACGNDDAEDAGEAGGDVTTFVIGFGGPLTQGSISFGQGALRATELAVAQANESDEAKDLGIQFRVAEGDDESDAQTGIVAAEGIVSQRNLVGVVGHFNSAVTRPANAVYEEAGVVQISYGSTNPGLTLPDWPDSPGRLGENFFRTCGNDALQGPAAAQAAWDLGFRSVAVITYPDAYGRGLAMTFSEKWAELGGETLLDESAVENQTNYGPEVTRIRAANPDFVFFGGTYDTAAGGGALLARQLKDGGVDVPMMGGDGIQSAGFIEEAGPQSEGTIATKPGQAIEDMAGGPAFIDAFTDMHAGEVPGGFDAFAYDAANAIIRAVFDVARTQGVDAVATPAGRQAIIDYVAAINFEGVTGPVSFDALGDRNNAIVTTFLVEDGGWIVHPDVDAYVAD